MISRRDILKGALATGSLGALATLPQKAEANWGMQEPTHGFDGSPLINIPQAYKVLDEAGLDGLVAFNPVNVFYLGNHLGYNVKIQTREPSFAVFPRDKTKPTILVVGFGDLWHIANSVRDTPQIIPYSAPANWQSFEGKSAVADGLEAIPGFGAFWPINETRLSAREADWVAIEKKFTGQFMPTPQHALVKALKEAGLEKAKVAVDDMRLSSILASAGHTRTTCIDGDNLFRKIRVVKSDIEVKHMRRIAQANQNATINMVKRIGVGATNADIDRIFAEEAAKQGANSTWLAAGSIGGLVNGEIVKGQPILVDAVSQINYYHGDFGRTVVVGEPSKAVLERSRLLSIGWQAALDIMRPGIKYSEIEAAARKAMKGSGLMMPTVFVVPHSVGLQHTDEPYRDNLPFQVKDDLVLQENMTLTVDLPCLELGWGNCHLEDLVVITKQGVEPLAQIDDPLIVI